MFYVNTFRGVCQWKHIAWWIEDKMGWHTHYIFNMTRWEKPLGQGPFMIFIYSPIIVNMFRNYKCAPLYMCDQFFLRQCI